jgi:hypothetical protein
LKILRQHVQSHTRCHTRTHTLMCLSLCVYAAAYTCKLTCAIFWKFAGTLGPLVEPRVLAPHRRPLPKRTRSLGKPQFWRKSTEGTGRRLWCSRAGSRRGQHAHGPHPPLPRGPWVACAPCSALRGNRRRVSCAKAIATTRHKFPS